MVPSILPHDNAVLDAAEETRNSTFIISDAVDDIIQKVIASRGDVEFVDQGVLKDYQHIALVRCY